MTFVTRFAPGHPSYSRYDGRDTDVPVCTGQCDCECGNDHDECECGDCSSEPVDSVIITITRTVTHTVTLEGSDILTVTGARDGRELRQILDRGSWYPGWDIMSELVAGEYGSCDETDDSLEFESIEEG